MNLGFETIGNATLLCHDGKPVLVTDPWIQGSAYFGSWGLSHEVPHSQFQSAVNAEFVWISHGHPDHMNPDSMPLFMGKKILLPDHVGGRIQKSLTAKGFTVNVLPDRKWVSLSKNIKVLSIADPLQDAILLVDIGGKLIVNINDAPRGAWTKFVKRTIRSYADSFLLALCCYGDVDMINCYTESGEFLAPELAPRISLGRFAASLCDDFGTNHFVPFSSMHRYQREDSVWTNQYGLKLSDYTQGFDSDRAKLLPAFISYDVQSGSFVEIAPRENPPVVLPPSQFGDDWSQRLDRSDVKRAESYFKAVTHLWDSMDFIKLRVGGVETCVEFKKRNFKRGVTFEAPRHSLMASIDYEIFDDMLIGNFMKTTFHGDWMRGELAPHLVPHLTKYADNGLAKTASEVSAYLRAYRYRSLDNVLFNLEEKTREYAQRYLRRDTPVFHVSRLIYRRLRRLTD